MNRVALPLAGILLLVLITIIVYWPGLQGGFLLDDRGNLAQLVQFGDITNFESLLNALGSGLAGPLGRPVALLSFLLNDNAMPVSAYDYKYTNVLLHAVNGLLLFWLLHLLTSALEPDPERAMSIALLGAAFWTLHPLWVSTTLYVVQRMAMLATTFSLAAFILFVKGRVLIASGRLWPGLARISAGLGGFGVLALFSKENAGLLPLQMLVLEVFLFRAPQFRERFPAPRLYRCFVLLAFVLPNLVLAAWLAQRWEGTQLKAMNNWGVSMGERALLESRVVFEYLRLLFLPSDVTRGVFYDDIRVAGGWLSTGPLVLAQLGLVALCALAWRLRRNFAVGAVAIAFFLASHVLETWLAALEFAFEHRNYLPALLLFWPLAWMLHATRVRAFLQGRGPALLGGAIIFMLAAMTASRSTLWSSPFFQSQAWAANNPQSERSHAFAAETLVKMGRHRDALAQLQAGLSHLPDNATLSLGAMELSCRYGQAGLWMEQVRRTIAIDQVRADHYYQALNRMLNRVLLGDCPGLTARDIQNITLSLQANPRANRRAADIQRINHLLARTYLVLQDPEAAMQAYYRSIKARPELGGVLRAAVTLQRAGLPERGLELLDHWEQIGSRIGYRGTGVSAKLRERRRDLMLAELAKVRDMLEQSVARQASPQ